MNNLKKNLSLFFSRNWPIITITLVVIVFFWKFFIAKMIPISGDLLIGAYFPWLDYKWGFPSGVPVKNPITSDVFSFIYPMQTFAGQLLRGLEWPLWNPYILGGVPLLANFQSAGLHPLNFLYFIFDSMTAWSLQIILQHIACGAFTYLLLRYWKASKAASLIGGLGFAFSGFNLIWSQWNGHGAVASLIPLLLYFLSRWFNEKKTRWIAATSITLAAQIFSGYPQVVLYTLLALSFYWLFYLSTFSNKLKQAVLFLLIITIGFGLAAPQILPGQELLSLSQREVEPHPYEWAFLPREKVITFIAPDYFGNHSTGNYWGPQDYTSNTGFVGVIVFGLATLALFVTKKRNARYSMFLIVIGLALSFPTPISVLLWESGILGFQAAAAHRALVLFNLGVVLLAAYGFDSLIKKNNIKFLLKLAPMGLLIGFFALNAPNNVALRNLILPAGVFATLVIVLALNNKLNKLKFVLLPLLIVEMFYFGWKFTPFTDRELVFPSTPVIDFLQRQEKPFRVVADHVIPINVLMNYQIETLEGYDAIYPQRNSEFISLVNSGSEVSESRRYAIIDNYKSELLDIANVEYLVEFKDKVLPEDIVVFEDKSVVVIKNQDALPRAYFKSNKTSEVVFAKYTPDHIVLETKNDQDDVLILSDTYYPGWVALINGREVPINIANHVFRSIEVPKGEHSIEFIYKPRSFSSGLIIASVAICALILIVWKKEL